MDGANRTHCVRWRSVLFFIVMGPIIWFHLVSTMMPGLALKLKVLGKAPFMPRAFLTLWGMTHCFALWVLLFRRHWLGFQAMRNVFNKQAAPRFASCSVVVLANISIAFAGLTFFLILHLWIAALC